MIGPEHGETAAYFLSGLSEKKYVTIQEET